MSVYKRTVTQTEQPIVHITNGADNVSISKWIVKLNNVYTDIYAMFSTGDANAMGTSSVPCLVTKKNLRRITLESQIINGVTITKNTDDTISVSGSPTETTHGIILSSEFVPYQKPFTTMSITFIPERPAGINFRRNGSSNNGYINYNMDIETTYDGEPVTFGIQEEVNEQSTNYEPCNRIDQIITFNNTIYGGIFDVLNGIGTITNDAVLVSDLQWTREKPGTNYIFVSSSISDMETGVLGKAYNRTYTLCCNYRKQTTVGSTSQLGNYNSNTLTSISNSMGNKYITIISDTKQIAIRDDGFSTVEDFLTAYDGVKIRYPLATPQSISFTPIQVPKIYSGVMNLYCPYGVSTVTYESVEHKYTIQENTLVGIADKLREKTGKTTPIEVTKYADEILTLNKALPHAEEEEF